MVHLQIKTAPLGGAARDHMRSADHFTAPLGAAYATRFTGGLDFSGCVMCIKLALCNTNHEIVFQSICLGHVDVIPLTDLTQ